MWRTKGKYQDWSFTRTAGIANKKRICYFASMPVRSCRVAIQDMHGVSHTVEITAATLYEAVAQGLAAIRANEWVAGIAQGLNVVKVSVAEVRVEHEVKLMDFTKWLEKNGGSPREVSDSSKDSVDPWHAGLALKRAHKTTGGQDRFQSRPPSFKRTTRKHQKTSHQERTARLLPNAQAARCNGRESGPRLHINRGTRSLQQNATHRSLPSNL